MYRIELSPTIDCFVNIIDIVKFSPYNIYVTIINSQILDKFFHMSNEQTENKHHYNKAKHFHINYSWMVVKLLSFIMHCLIFIIHDTANISSKLPYTYLITFYV